jgi:oligopeptide/dipeptide ABC transporter ATP-binding protein
VPQDLQAEKALDTSLPPLDPIRAGEPLLSVRDLKVHFQTDDGLLKAVDGVSYDIYPNEVMGIVGESGSGKSVSSLAIMGLLPKSATVTGEIVFRGHDLLHMAESDRRKLRGGRLAMVFQDALAALNPVFTVGDQIAEAIAAHQPPMSKQAKRDMAIELLNLVGIPNPAARVDQYPHEFSGGMRQRAMIAMSISNEPDVLIADEPTTALDVTIQAQVLEVLERIQERTNSAIVLITHDLGVVAGVADRVMVMYAGRPVEMSVVDEIFYHPRHPYTIGLMASLPPLDAAGAKSERLYRIKGQPPSLIFLPSGCPFHPRCEFAELPAPCSTIRPSLELVDHTYGRHLAACHRRHEMADVNPDELHADIGAELEAIEDAAALSATEAAAIEQLSVPAAEEK